MDYRHESWLPWYRRPTPGWLELSLEARGALISICMELHPETGEVLLKRGLHSIAKLIDATEAEIANPLAELLATGKLTWNEATRVLADPAYPQRKRPTSTERVRQFRLGRNVSSVPVTQKRREIEIEDPPIAPPSGGPTNGVSGDRKARVRGTRLSSDWTPGPATLEWAKKQAIAAPLGPLEEFRDYWTGVPGHRGVKLDWEATYRNRLRQVATRNQAESAKREEGARPMPYHRPAGLAETKPERLSAEELAAPLRALGDK